MSIASTSSSSCAKPQPNPNIFSTEGIFRSQRDTPTAGQKTAAQPKPLPPQGKSTVEEDN